MKKIEEIAKSFIGLNKSVVVAEYPCQEWCAAFVSYVVSRVDDRIDTGISCTRLAATWDCNKLMKRVTVDDIQNGDIVFFDWDASGDCDHIAIITDFDGDISTGAYYINGNGDSAERVTRQYMTYQALNKNVARVFRYIGDPEQKPAEQEPEQKTPKAISFPQIKQGASGGVVKILQALLIAGGYSCGTCGADADYGNDTRGAVIAFQRDNGLLADGIVGSKTWASLLNEKRVFCCRTTTF